MRANRKRWPDLCEKCDAKVGYPCTTPKGKVTNDHLARRDAARAKQQPAGRPGLLTPTVQQQVCDSLAKGVPLYTACLAVGIHTATVNRWIARADTPIPPDGEDDPDAPYRAFREAVTRARARGQQQLVDVLHEAMVGGRLKERTTRTLRDGTQEVTEKFTEPDPRSAMFMLERAYGRDFGRRQVVDLNPGDAVEPQPRAGAGPGLDSGGVERIVSGIAQFRERKQLELERAQQDEGVVEGEVMP